MVDELVEESLKDKEDKSISAGAVLGIILIIIALIAIVIFVFDFVYWRKSKIRQQVTQIQVLTS